MMKKHDNNQRDMQSARRNTNETEARVRTCHDCAYVIWDAGLWLRTLATGWPIQPICGNHADTPGQMREIWTRGVCANFRAKWQPAVRLDPPKPPSDEVRYIALTKGKFAIVDAADFERLNRYKWNAMEVKGKWYARRSVPGGGVMLMHREIMNAPDDMVVDHINGNGLDNRQANLRVCTAQQNCSNSRSRGGASRYLGVSRHRDKWTARIKHEGEVFHLGLFDDEVAAARARDAKALELQGEFAYLNFPPPKTTTES
ncbi:MAG: HNH endonuclease [Phycisphaerales bacterium]|nr:MAG: HNH endonuclease [Phycisphaerales bacterium]